VLAVIVAGILRLLRDGTLEMEIMVTKTGPKTEDISRKFWRNVSIGDGCWEWQGRKYSNGYGEITTGGRKYRVRALTHRFSYEVFFGEIGSGLMVCHKCDNRACVNPEHLFLGTAKDNMRDASKKGRLLTGDAMRRAQAGKMPYGEKHHRAKYTEAQALQVLSLRNAGLKAKQVAEKTGYSYSWIYHIYRGDRWKHLSAA
jgi:hypothetical protein